MGPPGSAPIWFVYVIVQLCAVAFWSHCEAQWWGLLWCTVVSVACVVPLLSPWPCGTVVGVDCDMPQYAQM
jgi:hypothetical protein